MTREIKFRAWNIKDKYMFEPMRIHLNKNPTVHLVRGCEVMQFTGLHDKNGKEIYEGDVIRAGTKIIVVEWMDLNPIPTFVFVMKPEDQVIMGEWKKSLQPMFEVIGNIYETPSLISGESNNG